MEKKISEGTEIWKGLIYKTQLLMPRWQPAELLGDDANGYIVFSSPAWLPTDE